MSKKETFEDQVGNLELEKETTLSRHDVEDSPFVVIGNEENGFVGTMGKYRITEEYQSVDECKDELSKITWNRIIQVLVLINQINEVKDEQ